MRVKRDYNIIEIINLGVINSILYLSWNILMIEVFLDIYKVV